MNRPSRPFGGFSGIFTLNELIKGPIPSQSAVLPLSSGAPQICSSLSKSERVKILVPLEIEQKKLIEQKKDTKIEPVKQKDLHQAGTTPQDGSAMSARSNRRWMDDFRWICS
ncbi:hypothetical protein D3C76_110580 [compost metagenome]